MPIAGGYGSSAEGLIDELRTEVTPQAGALIPGADRALVGGAAADGIDFKERMTEALPIVIAVILGLALILMLAGFRSLPLAISVIGLNLASVAAAFGVLTFVFQNSWAEGLINFTSFGAIVDWVPIFVFVILFALSMDYTILVLERMKEARRAGNTPREAARIGVSRTAGAVTSAAVVMVAIFMIFPVLPLIEMKMMGITLAIGILLDATIVRGLALPAAITLLGEKGLRAVGTRAHEDRSPGAKGATWDDHAEPEVIAHGSRR